MPNDPAQRYNATHWGLYAANDDGTLRPAPGDADP